MQINMKHIVDVMKKTKPQVAMVYLIVKEHDGVVTAKQIADEMGMTTRNVRYLLQELVEHGYITKLQKGYNLNR